MSLLHGVGLEVLANFGLAQRPVAILVCITKYRAGKGHTGSDADDPAKTHRAGDHGVSGGEMGVTSDKEGGQMHRHYSVREAAALSDFPHDYAFSGSWGDGLRQIGNAVPCNLGEAVGNSIHQALAA